MSTSPTAAEATAEATATMDMRSSPPPQNELEPDNQPAETPEPEGYETDSASSASTSIASSVRDYVFENNRRYHKFKEGRYLIPNDDIEQEREDMKHTMVLHVSGGKLHFAPLEHPQKIMDLGTGTGIWAIDMGDEYPGAEVVGMDLSPIQPSFVPPNVKFFVDDIESTWVEKPNSVDYIHTRHMRPAIKDWPQLLQQARDALVPGGWVEIQDLALRPRCDDGTMPDDYGFGVFIDNLIKGFQHFGVDLDSLKPTKELLEEAGFERIEEKVFKVPIGTWARDPKMKTVGLYNRSVISDALQGVGMGPLGRGLQWSIEEIESFLVGVRRSLADSSVHAYYTYHAVYGQKPLDA